jgi:hypothetical protein
VLRTIKRTPLQITPVTPRRVTAERGSPFDVPSIFIGGDRDWGTYSAPGALDLMQTKAATRMAASN